MAEQHEVVDQNLIEFGEAARSTDLRCLVCNTPVLMVVCGRKSPCPGCGFPYPLGDCSDLAEN